VQTPAELLAELERNLHRLPGPVGAWLAAGIKRYRHDVPLEKALGLTGPGARRHRDEALRRAAQLIAPGERRWQQAEILRRALRYTGGRSRRYSTPPDTLTGYRLELWRAMSFGLAIPRSRRGLYDILTENEIEEFQ